MEYASSVAVLYVLFDGDDPRTLFPMMKVLVVCQAYVLLLNVAPM
jgi:hypothetical protein